MDSWSPDQYARFAAERAQPFEDLLALVLPAPGIDAVDLGCGPGELTARLHATLRAATTLGIDSSPAMLERAKRREGGGLSFELGDLRESRPQAPFDLIFSNAALHWVEDHPALLARLFAQLRPRGQLAVQIPCNDSHPSHRAAAEVAREPLFKRALEGYVRTSPVLPPADYAAWLHRLGADEQHVRLQIYTHQLPSREAVVEWTKGTTLTDYQARLSPELFGQFLQRYQAVLMPQLADERPFFYTFARLLFWARKPG